MKHAALCRRSAVLLALGISSAACSSLAYRSRVEEFHNADLSATRYTTVAVLPVDPNGFDMNIAARVRDHLLKEGLQVIPAIKLVGEGEVTTKEACEPGRNPGYTGIVFVTWDRLIVRDCATTAVAYRAVGGYAGVDKLTQRLVAYLKTPPTAGQKP